MVSRFGQHQPQSSSYSTSRGHLWNHWKVCDQLPCWKLMQNPDHLSTTASKFWVLPTKAGEVDWCLFVTCRIALRPQGGKVETIPTRTGEGEFLTLTALWMLPGVIPLTLVLINFRIFLLTHAPPDDASTMTSFVSGNKSVCGVNEIGAILW